MFLNCSYQYLRQFLIRSKGCYRSGSDFASLQVLADGASAVPSE